MHVNTDDLAALLKIQHLDVEAIRAQKKLEALPQRKAIMEVRAKRRTVEAKRDQVQRLHDEASKKLAQVSDEDERLAEKQRAVQAEIEAVRGDYRSVEARTKELGGFAKRRAALEEDLTKLGDELAKIEAVRAQVDGALMKLDEQERAATESFVAEGGALKQEAHCHEAERAELAAQVTPAVLDQYEKTAARTGGVAIARLQGTACGACRVNVEHGRLVDLKAHGNVGTCPNCGRMLILG